MNGRDTSIDNAKGLLILLVLFGHLAWPVPSESQWTDASYLFVYVFHMPMFALVSGYLSKARWSADRLLLNARRLLLPYALFMALQYGSMLALGQTPHPIAQGQFGLWFLLSLFCWRTMLPLIMHLPFPFLLSVGMALLSGAIPELGMEFSLARTFNLFPFFVAGHLMTTAHRSPTESLTKPVALAIILITAFIAWPLARHDLHVLFYGAYSYDAMGLHFLTGAALRAGQLFLAFACGFAVLALIPKHKGILTRFGTHSLHIYLLHSFLLVFYRGWPPAHEVLGNQPGIMLVAAFMVCYILSSKLVIKATTRLVSPW